MNWRPLGLIYKTDSWAQCPTPLVMQDRVRVYFASRTQLDDRPHSMIEFADLDLDDPTQIIGHSHAFADVLENGKPGTFDDEGQIPSYAEWDGGQHHVALYYSGWNTRNTIPYHNATGIAFSENGGRTFQRRHDGPLLDRSPSEPYLRVTPCRAGSFMWYVSGLRWEMIDGRYEPIYVIRARKYGEINPIAIPQEHDQECFSRPWVIGDKDRWRMWYCFRAANNYRDGINAYRIGYAEAQSADGPWTRQDTAPEARIPHQDFDGKMQCYPAVFDLKGKRYMLYNGNTFGKHGFGLAVAE